MMHCKKMMAPLRLLPNSFASHPSGAKKKRAAAKQPALSTGAAQPAFQPHITLTTPGSPDTVCSLR